MRGLPDMPNYFEKQASMPTTMITKISLNPDKFGGWCVTRAHGDRSHYFTWYRRPNTGKLALSGAMCGVQEKPLRKPKAQYTKVSRCGMCGMLTGELHLSVKIDGVLSL